MASRSIQMFRNRNQLVQQARRCVGSVRQAHTHGSEGRRRVAFEITPWDDSKMVERRCIQLVALPQEPHRKKREMPKFDFKQDSIDARCPLAAADSASDGVS